MVRTSLPPPDRAALSERTRDHLHAPRTKLTRWDVLSFAVDLVFAFGGVLLVGFFGVMAGFGVFGHGRISPQILAGVPKYEAATWLVLGATTVVGLFALIQFWQRRIFAQTYGTKAQLWTGLLGLQLLLGAVMPLVCVMFLCQGGLTLSAHCLFFVAVALIYIRHALQVISWSFG